MSFRNAKYKREDEEIKINKTGNVQFNFALFQGNNIYKRNGVRLTSTAISPKQSTMHEVLSLGSITNL